MVIKMRVGDRFESKAYGWCVVEKYVNSQEVYIKFDNTGGISKAAAGNIRSGLVRDNFAKTVYGVGYFGNGRFKSRLPNNGPCTKEYGTWSSMIFRCYGDNRDETILRNYSDCMVCEDWHNFQTFAEWCQTQPEMMFPDSSIDKDILVKGNRIYSPETCCFVPTSINNAVTGIKHMNSTGRAGIWKLNDSYIAEVTMFSTKHSLGTFEKIEDADYVYKKVKETYIASLAEIYQDRISEKVYEKLKVWKCD